MDLRIVPVTYKAACEFIDRLHRHHRPPQGHKFSIGVAGTDGLVGVVTVGRPVSRMLDTGTVAEVTRLCTDGTKNACSMLYSAAWKAARAMGYDRLITYVLESEPGTSLRAAGWTRVREAGGGSWSRAGRERDDKAPLDRKVLWQIERK